jgi:hypothetical protein
MLDADAIRRLTARVLHASPADQTEVVVVASTANWCV